MINKYHLDIILYFLMNINNVRTTAIASIINTLIFVASVDVLRRDLSVANSYSRGDREFEKA